jgi:short-subunit dehydrogenase
MTTIAIFGAGPALGLATARRFGREGYRVGLVARDAGHLDALAAELSDAGVEAAGFTADLTDRAAALGAAEAIEARFGPIDVLAYSPAGDGVRGQPSELAVETGARLLEACVLTPLALVRRLLPGLRERGDGGLLFALGAAARYPVPGLAGGSLALAGLRAYLHALHDELAPAGVFAGNLLIGALIEGSAAHRNAAAWGGSAMAVVSADDLAERFWDMYTRRDRVEDTVAPGLAAAGA